MLIRHSGCERRSRARLIRANGTSVTGLAAVESHNTGGSLLEGVMPVASECVRRAWVESAQSIMWGWCGRTPAIGLGVQRTTTTAWHGCWDLLLNEDLGGWAVAALRLITLLVCVRHLMLLGSRVLVDGCRGPIMTAVSIVDHHQLSIASSKVSWKRACQRQPFCITCVISSRS